MRLKIHFTISLIIGLIFGLIFQSYLIGFISWLIGWTIDSDHLLDYFIYLREFRTRFNLKEFFSGSFLNKLGKLYFLVHAWEYLILFLILGFWKLDEGFVLAVGSSYFLHLVLDQYRHRNKLNKFIYFLTYRIKVGFDKDKLCHD